MSLFGGYIADPISGQFVSEKHARIAEIIQDYNPNLELKYLPAAVRTIADLGKEFCVIHRDPETFAEYVVMYVAEDDLDHRVIATLFDMDSSRTDIEARLTNLETAAELVRMKEKMDIEEERRDKITSILKSPLHTYTTEHGRKLHK
jgi:hypothetical protein